MWYLWQSQISQSQEDRRINNVPGKSLYGFNEHCINPELVTIVKLVQGEELDVLVDDDGGPGAVDAVATIFPRKSRLLGLKQDPMKKSHKISFPLQNTCLINSAFSAAFSILGSITFL
jgi:hypothetical protein